MRRNIWPWALAWVACASPRPVPQTSVDPFVPAQLLTDVAALVAPAMEGRGSYQSGARTAADYVATKFAEANLVVKRQAISGTAENVFGVLRGGESIVIVSAHHDHLGIDRQGTMFPGADDNASGVAVLLALAKAHSGLSYPNTIVFVSFGAEEAGLVGSGHYVHNPLWPLRKTVAMINFDMVGRKFFEAGSDRDATMAIVGLEDHPGLRQLARAAAKQSEMSVLFTPARLLELFGFDDRTDDWWFRRQGILSIHFSTGLHDDYHRATDVMEKLSPSQLRGVARTASALLSELARAKN